MVRVMGIPPHHGSPLRNRRSPRVPPVLRGLLHVKRPRPIVPPFDLARAAEVRRWRDRLPLSLSLDTIGDESLADATAVGLCVEAQELITYRTTNAIQTTITNSAKPTMARK